MKTDFRRRSVLLALMPFVLLAAFHWSDGPGETAGDYSQYLLHARALWEGKAYTDIGYIYTEYDAVVGPRAYPPGLPVLLLPAFALGGSIVLMRLTMVGLAIAFLVVAGRYFAEHDESPLWLGVVAFSALSPRLVHSSTQVASDLAFSAFVWGILVLGDRPTWRPRQIVLMSVLAAGAVFCRTAGVALVPALSFLVLVRWRDLKLWPLVPAASAAAAFLVTNAMLPVSSSYMDQVSLNPIVIVRQMAANVVEYRFAVFDGLLYPFPSNVLNDVYHTVGVPVAAIGIGLWLARGPHAWLLVSFCAWYLLVLLPFHASPARYVWPLFPVLVFGTLYGTQWMVGLIAPQWKGERSRAAALATLAFLAFLSVFHPEARMHEGGVAKRPDVRALFAALQAKAAVERVRVAFFKPRVMAWEASIPTMAIFAAEVDEILEELEHQGITHVVVGDLGHNPQATAAFARATEERPDRFALEFENPSVKLYRFTPPETLHHE